MSQNQIRGDKKELQYRKTGVVGGARHNNSSDYQQRSLSGGSGTAPSLSHNAPANRSFKKPNNGQGGLLRGHSVPLNSSSDPNPATRLQPVENGSHVQSTTSGASHKPAASAVIPKPTDVSSPKSSQPVQNSRLFQTSSMTPNSTLPATPSKGDSGKGFSLQFGSISPGIVNVMQVPARTSSAPPNMDEQQRNQALRTTSRTHANPALSALNQQMANLDTPTEKPTSQEPHTVLKVTRDVPVTSAPPPIQPQKLTVLPVAGISTPMQFTLPTGPMHFGGPNTQIPSQSIRPNRHQVPIQMPFGGPNTMPSQPPILMQGLPHHLMSNQGIIHQGPGFGFNPPMPHPPPHQPGTLGINMSPQLNQPVVNFNSTRKTVKITHPETHEELKLDDKNNAPPNSSSRVDHIAPYTSPRPGGFYHNSYTSGSPFIAPSNSLPLTSSSSLAPRLNYSGQGGPTLPFVNQVIPQSASALTPTIVKPTGSSREDVNTFEIVGSTTSTNNDVEGETAQKQSEQKGCLRTSSKGHVEPSTVGILESTTPAPNQSGSKVGILNVVHKSSASIDALDNGTKDKSTENKPTTKDDSHLISVTKDESETYHSEGLQSDKSLKAEKPDEVKKYDHKTGFVEGSHTNATTAYGAGIDACPRSANLSETTLECEVEIIENARSSSSSGLSKISVATNKAKNNKGKKKRKEMFQKAEALGTNPDLYMAYKSPNEYSETIVPEESVLDHNKKEGSGPKLENGLAKKIDEPTNKPELENWEDVADGSTPKLESSDNVRHRGFNHDDGGTIKKYSRDFLLTISEKCMDLPEGFQITPDIADVFSRINMNDSRDYPGSGRINDRLSGSSRHDRRGNGSMDANRWAKPNHLPIRDPGMDLAYASNMIGRPVAGANYGVRPRGQGPLQHSGGILPGMMHSSSFQGNYRNNLEGDRWQKSINFNKGAMASPQPSPVMHRAEKKYEVGKVSDEEQAKQRRLTAILNKLTPQNFEKLFEQVKEVNIDNVVTLTGVISQIFDKALMEPTFCEMYANFCHHLASELPELSVDDQKITFRRLLLNKCQEEFERGEREEEEVNKDEDEKKQSDQEREEKRLKVRRCMLGNIRLIGELYKKRMLTERIMHECIKKLLGHYENADEENIEALCKLMSTIGEMIDHSKAKEHMDAYFDIMRQLSNDMKLSSRVRFMLKDTIDLRRNRWQQRRKVEGPKKIEEVHRAAAQERMGQTSRLSRGPSMNSTTRRGPPLEYAPRGSVLSSSVSQGGSFRSVGPQFDNRAPSAPLLQRSSGDGPIMLGLQGGLARGMSIRGQPPGLTGPTADNSSSHGDSRRGAAGVNGYSSRVDQFPRNGVPVNTNDHFDDQERNSNATQKLSSYPEERLRELSMAAIKEYYSAKDVKEVELCIKDLNAPSYYPTVISMWVTDSFERKDMERNVLTKLLVCLTKPREGTFSPHQLIQGFESLLIDFEDTVTDAPRAPEFLGRMFGSLVIENVLPMQDVCKLIQQGGEEPGRLLEAGLAADVLGSILETIKLEKGDVTLAEIRTSSNLRLEDYLPPKPLKSSKLQIFL